ncbi:MAG: ubiquinone/menaquinone biosynthesis C-methylase UbiE [Saprospiraceae bacterium]|jgi:ubiquinone/menaquinone biosynthesis C-methylase UbiE|tara:strand:- start:150 stop:788 length:639 start_codon:yes stop_codon:yes gene_type:complete
MMDKRTKETVKIFNDAAQGYQDKYMDVSPYASSLTLFCGSLSSVESDILDVACGPGNVAKFIFDMLPEVKITASDLSDCMLKLTKENVPMAETVSLDAKEIRTLGRKFDGVMASFILPYLTKSEVFQFIMDSTSILKENGILYISTMQGLNSDSGYSGPSDGVQMYMNYHEVEYLEKAFVDGHFEIISSKLQPYDYGTDNNGTDIIIIGKKR